MASRPRATAPLPRRPHPCPPPCPGGHRPRRRPAPRSSRRLRPAPTGAAGTPARTSAGRLRRAPRRGRPPPPPRARRPLARGRRPHLLRPASRRAGARADAAAPRAPLPAAAMTVSTRRIQAVTGRAFTTAVRAGRVGCRPCPSVSSPTPLPTCRRRRSTPSGSRWSRCRSVSATRSTPTGSTSPSRSSTPSSPSPRRCPRPRPRRPAPSTPPSAARPRPGPTPWCASTCRGPVGHGPGCPERSHGPRRRARRAGRRLPLDHLGPGHPGAAWPRPPPPAGQRRRGGRPGREPGPRTHVIGALDTLENLKKGGRIGGAQALLGSLLSIKPLLDISSGEVDEAGKARTRRKALEWLRDTVFASPQVEHLCVAHGGAPRSTTMVDLLALRTRDDTVRSPRSVRPSARTVAPRHGPHVGRPCMMGTLRRPDGSAGGPYDVGGTSLHYGWRTVAVTPPPTGSSRPLVSPPAPSWLGATGSTISWRPGAWRRCSAAPTRCCGGRSR